DPVGGDGDRHDDFRLARPRHGLPPWRRRERYREERTPMTRATLFHAGAFALLVLGVTGCDDGADFDVSQQIGPDPVLPEPSQSLLPDLKVAEVVGWQDGQ